MAGVFQICLIIGGIVNLSLIDYAGRRILFLSGLILLSVCLGLFAAFSAKFGETASNAWGKAGVSMVMIFIFFFGATFNASPYAYAAEVLPTKIRAKGMVIALFCANAITVMFTQTAPIALEAITWKFSFIFVACNLAFFPIIWIFFPETKGLTLEEVNRAFGDKVEVEMDQMTDAQVQKMGTEVRHFEQQSEA